MDKVQKPIDSECCTPLSNLFRIHITQYSEINTLLKQFLQTTQNVSCSLKTFTITAFTKKKEVEEETIINVQKTPDDTEEEKEQEEEELQELFSKKVIEEEMTVEVIPHQGVLAEGIEFLTFLCII
jgi:hypothetical protein